MRSRLPLFIVLIALLLAGLLAFFYAANRLRRIVEALPATVESQLQATLNRDVRVGDMELTAMDRAVLTDLEIAAGETFEEGTLLTVPRTIVRFRPLDVLFGRVPLVRAIDSITLHEPTLSLIRDVDGIWNIQDLLERPPVPPEERFRGLVRIRDGSLNVTDFAAELDQLPGVNALQAITGTLDFSPTHNFGVNLAAQGTQGRVEQLRISGRFGIDRPETDLRLAVQQADAGYWLDYFTEIGAWNLEQGRLSGTVTITQPTERYLAQGSLQLRESAFTSPYLTIPIRPFAANISFEGTDISISGRGLLGQSPVAVRGDISGFDPIGLNLQVISQRMNLETLERAIAPLPAFPEVRWPTPGIIDLRITGTSQDPIVTGTLRTARAVAYGSPITNLNTRGIYRAGTIRVTEATARAAQGAVRTTAIIDLQPFRVRVSGTARGVNVAALPIPPEFRAAGIATGSFALDYLAGIRSARISADVTRGRISELTFARGRTEVTFTGPRTAEAAVSIAGGQALGIAISSATADLGLRNRVVVVRNAVAQALGGTVTARGTATLDGVLNLNVAASTIDMQALLLPLGYPDVTGRANFRGVLTGTVANPLVTGTVTARDGRFQDIEYDLLTGQIAATRDRLVLSDAFVRTEDLEIALVGRIVVAREAPLRLDIRLTAQRVPLQQVLGLLNIPFDATGIAAADLQVAGVYPDLRVSGVITVADAVVAGFPIDAARLQLETVGGRTVIRELTAQRDGMRLSGQGTIGPEGQIAVNIVGENLDLNLFNEVLYPYAILQGPVNATAQIGGTLNRPILSGSLVSTSPVVNRISFDSLTTGFTWDGARFRLADTSLLGRVASITISEMTLNPAVPSVNLGAAISTSDISAVLDIARNSPLIGLPEGAGLREFLAELPDPLTGAASASLRLTGTLGNLAGSAAIVAANLQLGDAVLTRAEIDLVSQQAVVMLRRVAITAPGVSLTADADFTAGMPTRIEATISDTDVGALVTLLQNATFLRAFDFGETLLDIAEGVPLPAAGTLNASISVSDMQTQPTGALTVTAEDVVLDETQVGDLNANVRLAAGTVFIDQVTFSPPEGEAFVSGTIDPEGIVSLTGRGTEIPLVILQPFLPLAELTGTLNFTLAALGPITDPVVTASVTATDIGTELLEIDRISAEQVRIAAGRLTSEQVVLQMNGSRILATVSLPFSPFPPFISPDEPIAISAVLEDEDLSILEGLTAFVEDASGTLIANLQVTGTLANPVLTGGIDLTDGVLSLRDFENDFINVSMNANFQESELLIEDFSAESTQGGTITASGNITFPELTAGLVTLVVNLESLRTHTVNISGTIGEELILTTTGQLLVTGEVGAPLVQGLLIVRDSRIVIPAAEVPTAIVVPTLPISPQLAITLDLARNVVVQRGALSAEVVGPTTITGTLANPAIAGTVQIVAGELTFIGASLIIQPGGTATFLIQPPAEPLIAVNVTATTRAVARSPITGFLSLYTVALDIEGPIGNLDIDVRTSPPGLTELEALALIFRGTALEALLRGVPFDDVLQEQLPQILLGFAIPGLFEPFEFGGLIVALQPGFDVPLLVTVSTPLTERLILSYSRSVIGTQPLDTFSLSYLLTPQLATSVQFQGRDAAPRETSVLLEYFTRF